jgi:ABC-type branched-subunit amino acid transport system ATPase component/ABC-type branched-subunit amino acid transport system permease subunit
MGSGPDRSGPGVGRTLLTEFLQFGLLGLGLGGIYALSAQGIVLVYRGSGVLNFAHGAMAAVGAFAYVEALDAGWGTAGAVAAGVTVAAISGALVHLLVMHWLWKASPLTRLVATLGVLTALQAALIGWPFNFGDAQRFVTGFLPASAVSFGDDISVSEDRLWILGVAALLSVVLWLVYRYTRFGLVTRAVAENEEAAATLGRSPDVIATINWSAGAGLAGLAGILVVPIIGLSVNQILLLLVPSLAAALVGNFTSFPLTFLGGVLIGVIEAELTSGADWIPEFLKAPGWSKSVPFLVIIAVLIFRGRALPLRSHINERMPGLGSGRIRWVPLALSVALVMVLVNGAGIVGFDGVHLNWVSATTTTVIGATICLSLVVVTGYTGQLSLAQYALAGIGAYIASRAASGGELVELINLGKVDFEVALLIGVLGAVPIGLLVGLPALRTRGVNLAIATLGLALLIERVVLGNADYTGGFEGTVVPSPDFLGINLDPVEYPRRYAIFCIVLFSIAGLMVANLRRGRSGRRLVAVRANERAAASLGISVIGAKLYAFGLAAGIAGLGGILLAFRSRTVLFTPYNVFNSIQVVVQTVLGGIGFIGGAIFGGAIAIGGALSYAMTELLGIDGLMIIFLSGVLLIISLIQFPDGVVAGMAHRLRWAFGVLRRALRFPARTIAPLPVVEREPVAPKVLVVEHVGVRFGGVVAVDDVSLEVHPGEVLGLIGPNGAGKTTLIDVITGFTPPDTGSVMLDGTSTNRWSPRRRAREGIGRSFQSLELFEDLNVLDNLRAASDRRDPLAYLTDLVWPHSPPLHGTAVAAVREFGLENDLDRKPSELPYGQRRLVGIARAVATRPSVLLLDEPAAGLDEAETRELSELVVRLAKEWGLGILLVEHDVSLVMAVCDRIVALDFGKVIATGTPEEIRGNDAVIAAYLGDPDDESSAASEPGSQREPVA